MNNVASHGFPCSFNNILMQFRLDETTKSVPHHSHATVTQFSPVFSSKGRN